jgi:hypothetical protein
VFDRHLNAENKSPRTAETYGEAVQQLEERRPTTKATQRKTSGTGSVAA